MKTKLRHTCIGKFDRLTTIGVFVTCTDNSVLNVGFVPVQNISNQDWFRRFAYSTTNTYMVCFAQEIIIQYRL